MFWRWTSTTRVRFLLSAPCSAGTNRSCPSFSPIHTRAEACGSSSSTEGRKMKSAERWKMNKNKRTKPPREKRCFWTSLCMGSLLKWSKKSAGTSCRGSSSPAPVHSRVDTARRKSELTGETISRDKQVVLTWRDALHLFAFGEQRAWKIRNFFKVPPTLPILRDSADLFQAVREQTPDLHTRAPFKSETGKRNKEHTNHLVSPVQFFADEIPHLFPNRRRPTRTQLHTVLHEEGQPAQEHAIAVEICSPIFLTGGDSNIQEILLHKDIQRQ